MFTLVGYSETYTGAATLDQVTPIADAHVRVEGNNIIVPPGMANLLGVYGLGSVLTQVRIDTPSLRRMLLLDVEPFDTNAEPASIPPLFNMFYSPIALDEAEPMRFLASASGAGTVTGLVWLGDGAQSPVTGEIFTARATASVSCTTGAWTNGALTFDQTLPAGRYQCVGMRAYGAGLAAARLVFVGQSWRPGCIGFDGYGDIDHPIFRRGAAGIWGEFTHDQPPTVDFLAVASTSSEVVYLDLIKVA